MTAQTNTSLTYDTKGIREDLSDIINRLSASETPFLNSIRSGKASNTKFEWQTEALDAVATTNAQLEGDVIATPDAPNVTKRVGNFAQIFRKTGSVAGTTDAVNLAGRDNEYNRQVLIKGVSLKRDIEYAYLKNQGSTGGDSANARTTAGALAWANSAAAIANTTAGSSGANGGYNTSTGLVAAATNGTLRQFTEDHVKTVMQALFTQGAVTGQRMTALMKADLKVRFSSFAGIAQLRHETGAGQATIVAGADVYQSDFGPVVIAPHAYALDRECIIYTGRTFADRALRPLKTTELAKDGDNRKFMTIYEGGLEVTNEGAFGVVRDIKSAA